LISKLEKNIIISSIKDHIEVLIYDTFGCHVLEKILTFIEEEYISFIYLYIFDNFLKLAYNSNGICTIKKLLVLTQEHYLHNKIKGIIIDNLYDLIQHPYGNFVIQGIVESWEDYRDIINLYKNKFFELSMEKYASNVIERFIEKDEEILNEYIDEIVKTDRTYEVMKSSYGNYVIQKALKISNGEHRKKLVFNGAKDIDNLIENKLIQKWKSLLSPYIQELTLEQIQILNDKNYFEKIK
jgi:pumilio RNA-binding family